VIDFPCALRVKTPRVAGSVFEVVVIGMLYVV
jgi:hypothetical protein